MNFLFYSLCKVIKWKSHKNKKRRSILTIIKVKIPSKTHTISKIPSEMALFRL